MGSSQIFYDLRTKQGLEIIKEELKVKSIRDVIGYLIQNELKKRGIIK